MGLGFGLDLVDLNGDIDIVLLSGGVKAVTKGKGEVRRIRRDEKMET